MPLLVPLLPLLDGSASSVEFEATTPMSNARHMDTAARGTTVNDSDAVRWDSVMLVAFAVGESVGAVEDVDGVGEGDAVSTVAEGRLGDGDGSERDPDKDTVGKTTVDALPRDRELDAVTEGVADTDRGGANRGQ